MVFLPNEVIAEDGKARGLDNLEGYDGCVRVQAGIWIGEHESASFWLGVCNGLKNRGVEAFL